MQLDHINIYVKDVAKSRAFYEAVLCPFGYQVVRDFGEFAVGFGDKNYSAFAIVREEAAIQTLHVAFRVDTRAEVDRFHALALKAGGTDNGAAGLRPDYHQHYYGAFVRDLDGHNIELVCHHKPAE